MGRCGGGFARVREGRQAGAGRSSVPRERGTENGVNGAHGNREDLRQPPG